MHPAPLFKNRRAVRFLWLAWVGTLCNGMLIPFMGFYIVEGLGQEPWSISLYSLVVIGLTLLVNRIFANALDEGARFAPFVTASALGFLLATIAVFSAPRFEVLLIFGGVGFGVASGFMATCFTLGRKLAESEQLNTDQFNAVLRATNSAAWMVGPAVSFGLADAFGVQTVFAISGLASVIWLALIPFAVPRWFRSPPADASLSPTVDQAAAIGRALWFSITGVFCLSLAHALCTSALPLFYTQEAGLPTFAPGLSFTIKTFVEVFAILATPWLAARYGARPVLTVTSLVGVLALLVLSTVSNLTQMGIGAAIEGLYYGLFAGTAISFVQSFAAGRMARATALYVNTLSLSFLMAGPAVGLIGQFFEFRAALQLAVLFAILSFAVFVAMGKTERAARV